jgi:hypothetical protein
MRLCITNSTQVFLAFITLGTATPWTESSKASSCSVIPEILFLLGNPNIPYDIHKGSLIVSVLSQMYPIHTFLLYLT